MRMVDNESMERRERDYVEGRKWSKKGSGGYLLGLRGTVRFHELYSFNEPEIKCADWRLEEAGEVDDGLWG